VRAILAALVFLSTFHNIPASNQIMILTTIQHVPGASILQHHGIVHGSTVRSKHAGKDILAGFKNMFGGELRAYTELLQETRDEAVKRMVEQAKQAGANAIVNIRFSTSSVAAGAAEIYVYGTAVTVG
jgi:uncharacterized protein YbjQ (UPF0145 family)